MKPKETITEMVKLIKVKDETHKRLAKLGSFGDSFDDIVQKLLDYYEGKKK
jgi:hypothetical protein